MLRLSKITKSYGKQTVIDSIDLDLQPGQTYALIGPSGCGKSTLLRIMIGLISADSGQVFLDDQELANVDVNKARKDFGYVIQSGGLFPHLTARKNASLPADYYQWPKQKIDERILELAALTQLPTDLLDRYPVQLSGGQRQRVSLIRALMLNPQILLMDEPLHALDPMIRSQLQTELRTIFESLGKTVVIVTHDLHEAAYFSKNIVLLKDGKIVQQGSIDDLLDQPANAFVTEFVRAQQSHLIHSSPGAKS